MMHMYKKKLFLFENFLTRTYEVFFVQLLYYVNLFFVCRLCLFSKFLNTIYEVFFLQLLHNVVFKQIAPASWTSCGDAAKKVFIVFIYARNNYYFPVNLIESSKLLTPMHSTMPVMTDCLRYTYSVQCICLLQV